MNQKRSCPGVPNRYSTSESSTVIRPKSMATVVVRLPGTAPRSSTPAEALVSGSSVSSGGISDSARTMEVFPTPKPPATTTLSGTGGRSARIPGLPGTRGAQVARPPAVARDCGVSTCPTRAASMVIS
jgi:hypothetical protein